MKTNMKKQKDFFNKRLIASALIAPCLLFTLFITGCSESKTNKNTSSTSTNPVTGNPTNPINPTNPTNPTTPTTNCPWGDGDEAGIADNGQTINYYRLNNQPYMAVAHGANFGTVVFSSDSDLPGYNQNAFFTDGRFNVRVIPRYQQGGTDSKGQSCNYNPSKFTKMNIGIVVRTRSQAPGQGDYYQFKDVPVNCASKVFEYSIPASSDPLVIDVMNVEWDFSCIQDQNTNGSTRFCPYANVWSTECYGVEIQFATDNTKDLPGPRVGQ